MENKKRLMLIGDSIAFEYGPYLKKMIDDKFVMYEKDGREIAAVDLDVAVGGNAGDSKNVVRFVKQMESEGRFNFDLLLFNCGLHDLKRNKPGLELQVPITEYESNLREVVDTENYPFIRHNSDVKEYNNVAINVMKEKGVPVIGLNEFTLSLGELSETTRDHAHYYPEVQQKQARFIADYIMSE